MFTAEARKRFVGINDLTERSIDILNMHNVKLPEEKLRLIETSQSAKRTKSTNIDEDMFCITGNTRPRITTSCRLMHGKELLRIMGITYVGDDINNWPSEFLCDLAGNAFDAGCCASMLMCILMTLARSNSKTKMNTAHATEEPSADQDNIILDSLWPESAP